MNVYARMENKVAVWKIDVTDPDLARQHLAEAFETHPAFRGPIFVVVDGGVPVREPEQLEMFG